MKAPISDCALIDLGATTLPAYEVKIKGGVYWVVWCKHCRMWHQHGAAEGHREAHCEDRHSPYWNTGYNLAYAGKWKERRA